MSNGERATIVCSIDTNEYSNEFTEADWSYLKEGVIIRTDDGTLIHYEDPNDDFVELAIDQEDE